MCSKQEKPTLKVKKSLGRKINFYAEDCSRYRVEAEVWSRFLAEVPIRFCG